MCNNRHWRVCQVRAVRSKACGQWSCVWPWQSRRVYGGVRDCVLAAADRPVLTRQAKTDCIYSILLILPPSLAYPFPDTIRSMLLMGAS